MLGGVGERTLLDVRQPVREGSRLLVDGDDAERCGECARARQRQSVNGDAVHRPQQDHAANGGGDGPQPRVRGRRDRPGVDVPGVRDDQRLRRVTGRAGRSGDVGQQAIDLGPQRGGFGRVESPGHGGSANVHAVARIHDKLFRIWGLGKGAASRLPGGDQGGLIDVYVNVI